MDILKALEPDIIFRQSPWLDLPPIFNPADINFARLCYVPYSFTAVKRIGKDEPKDTFSSLNHTDLYYHRLCWRIFCETEMHKEMYTSSIRGGQNVVVTGYPKFDRLISAKSDAPFWPIEIKHTSKPRFRIIWAPHHSVTPDVMAFGTFVNTHKEMLAWARQSENDYEFVLKPHPALVSEVVHNLKAYTQEYMNTYFADWNALPNTAIYEGGNYGPLFVASDVMLTDGVGFLSEYQLFEKPLIFLDSGCHFGFNAAGKIMIESANTIKSVAEARALCERLKNGDPDPMQAVQQAVLTKIMPYPGQSAQKILRAIRDGLLAEGVID
jgi:CDP-glycerol glycerophosphotransferase (TagB/SpsB family)